MFSSPQNATCMLRWECILMDNSGGSREFHWCCRLCLYTHLCDEHVTGVTVICDTKTETAQAVLLRDSKTVEVRRLTQVDRGSLYNNNGIRCGKHRSFTINCLTRVGSLVCRLGIWTN